MTKRKSKYWGHVCSTGVIEMLNGDACSICGKKRATKSKPKRSGKNGNK